VVQRLPIMYDKFSSKEGLPYAPVFQRD